MKELTKLLILFISLLLTSFSCETTDPELEYELEPYEEGYITGTFLAHRIVNGEVDENDTIRGFCIKLENGGLSNLTRPMDIYSFFMPENSFIYTSDIYKYRYNSTTCGPEFFRDSIISNHKIFIKYRDATENEKIDFSLGVCFMLLPPYPWDAYQEVIITEIKTD